MTYARILSITVPTLLAVGQSAAHATNAPDVLALLSEAQNPALKDSGLGSKLDRAVAGLKAPKARAQKPDATRGHDDASTLGIGAFGESIRDPRGLPGICARHSTEKRLKADARRSAERVLDRASGAISECYGTPKQDGKTKRDALGVSVIIDATGAVVSARVIEETKLGARGAEACAEKVVAGLRFPAGLTDAQAVVVYRWRFRLGGSTTIDF